MTELQTLRSDLDQALAINHAYSSVLAALIHSLPAAPAKRWAKELAEQYEKSSALGLASPISDSILKMRDGVVLAFLEELQNQK